MWDKVIASSYDSIAMKLENAELLKYLNGESSQKDEARIRSWMAEDTGNSKQLILLQKIWAELGSMSSFRMPVIDEAWRTVKSDLKSTSSTPSGALVKSGVQDSEGVKVKEITTVPRYSNNSTRSSALPWIYALFALIILGFLGWMTWKYFNPPDKNIEVAAIDGEHIIALADGSKIYLQPVSTLKYNKNFDRQKERRMVLDGEARFDIVSETGPFLVEYDKVSVRTLGTLFHLKGENNVVTAECVEGRIRFFETDNPTNSVDIETPQIFKYGNGVFENITPIPEEDVVEEENTTTITLSRLLDVLMEKSDWRIITAPSMPFDPSYEIDIDIDQDYGEIMEELMDKIDFIYEKANCDGCYLIKRMRGSTGNR